MRHKKNNKISKIKKLDKNIITQIPIEIKIPIEIPIEIKIQTEIPIQIPIPPIYNKLYNSFIYKIKRVKNITYNVSKLEKDETDIFFPYKFYIELVKDNKIKKFEIFLSIIICKYTIRLLSDNQRIKGYNKIEGLINEMLSQYKD